MDHDPYQGVADTYDRTFKLIPSREHVEAYTLLRRWGAARVLGIDISEDMVKVARKHDDP